MLVPDLGVERLVANNFSERSVRMAIDESLTEERLRLLELAKQLGNVSEACRIMGYSRDSFYRYRKLHELSGPAALTDKSKRQPLRKNRVPEQLEAAIVALAFEKPRLGQLRVSRLLRERGWHVSPGGVRSVWLRHDLETVAKRLKALEVQLALQHAKPTWEQGKSFSAQSNRRRPHIRGTAQHPGFLGVQTAMSLGHLKELGSLHQHTFLDVYSRVVVARIYTCHDAWAAADLLKTYVLPFYAHHEIRLLRILTPGEPWYCADGSPHAYTQIIREVGIEHRVAAEEKGGSLGLCQQLQEEMLNAFYCVSLRKSRYWRLTALQADLDEWVAQYNSELPQEGCYCYGQTPLATFQQAAHLALQ